MRWRVASLVTPLFLVLPCLWNAHPARARSTVPLNPPQAMNFTVEGKIHHLDANEFTLNTEGNIIFHVRYDEKTEVKRPDGSSTSTKELRVGLRVRVDGELTEAGEIIAQTIRIVQEPPPKK